MIVSGLTLASEAWIGPEDVPGLYTKTTCVDKKKMVVKPFDHTPSKAGCHNMNLVLHIITT